jgi:putative chitinase
LEAGAVLPTKTQLLAIAGGPANEGNVNSIIVALSQYGARFGLDLPHRLAHYFAQLGEETGGFKWDKELASGAEYEGRKDLGNIKPGDGVRFKGRTGIQITGRANYAAFTAWAQKNIPGNVPDFESQPDLLNTDPWEGMGPIWYWSTRNLNALADENNIEQITKKVNGGLNGFDVRVQFYTRAALVFLGYGPNDIRAFQIQALQDRVYTGKIDSDPGPKTRAALHMELVKLDDTGDAAQVATPAPVLTPVDKPVAVVAQGSDRRGWLWTGLSGISLSTVISAFADVPWQWKAGAGIVALAIVVIMLFLGDRIIRRVKKLRDEINAA